MRLGLRAATRGVVFVQRRAMPLIKAGSEKLGQSAPVASGGGPSIVGNVGAGVSEDALDADAKRSAIAEGYSKTVRGEGTCCVSGVSEMVGYTAEELRVVGDSDLSVGCGTPVALAQLQEGERVLDLGSGAGIDVLLAAVRVGKGGHAVGVDMTPDMLSKARQNAKEKEISNATFRLGEIEHLPAADNEFDVVLSNCVINLSSDKGQVLKEAYRCLRPGGRLAVSDVVKTTELPQSLKTVEALAC
eukprot:TRINITY_DN32068_c0_g1_i1.p2 TRINITY_DN32068_c0_g1~~TRINITY_DN32068_c0_g1_i1.p2  ORF type:complete len:245 (+),score=91.49 TRINITY_DN32068_c0_g1_i1:40-774(+)